MRIPILPALLCCMLMLAPAMARGASYPDLRDRSAPDPAPALPAGTDAFTPPVADITPPEGAPGISQWTRAAGPDQHIVVAGWNFTSEADPEGKATEFLIYAQKAAAGIRLKGRVRRIESDQAILGIPAGVPDGAMLLIWPKNSTGVGWPVAVNRAEPWYTLPRRLAPGETFSVYGRNLTHRIKNKQAWVYLKPKGKKEAGVLLAAESANPYKADYTLPEHLANGAYEVWVHNGHGGGFGWRPLHARDGGSLSNTHLTVRPAYAYDGPTLDVTKFGATPDDDTDDTEAILAALAKANTVKRPTLLFPAGTFYVSKPIHPVRGGPVDPGAQKVKHTGIRILGAGRRKTAIKGFPGKSPNVLLSIMGGNVEIRDLTLDINELGEARKFYREWDRPAHNAEHYAYLEQLAAHRHKVKQRKKNKKNKDKPLPPELQEQPPSPNFPDVRRRHALVQGTRKKQGKKRLITKDVWDGGLVIENCVLDAERQLITINKGLNDARIENCDFISSETQLGAPQFTLIKDCHFFGRADSGMAMYTYGGWCLSVTGCTAQDYMPNTHDTYQGRFFTVSAYGNRVENTYVGDCTTNDMTVNPMHWNQNTGEQIMWEFMPMSDTLRQKVAEAEGKTIRFDTPLEVNKLKKKLKKNLHWYCDVVIVGGKGMGQYRRIASVSDDARTVEAVVPWDVPPDATSAIQLGRPIRRCVAYGNHLDAKPRAARFEGHIASTGVEPFGASLELIVEANVFHQTRSGIATFSPYMFHRYENNRFVGNRHGMMFGGGTGTVVRHNTVEGQKDRFIRLGRAFKAGTGHDVIEHNRGKNLPVFMQFANQWNKAPKGVQQVLIYKNHFTRGVTDRERSIAIRAPDPTGLTLMQNVFEGFAEEIAAGNKKK